MMRKFGFMRQVNKWAEREVRIRGVAIVSRSGGVENGKGPPPSFEAGPSFIVVLTPLWLLFLTQTARTRAWAHVRS